MIVVVVMLLEVLPWTHGTHLRERMRLERAGIGAAVDQPVLSGDVTRVDAAQKGTGTAEFVGIAEASGGNRLHALRAGFFEGNVVR